MSDKPLLLSIVELGGYPNFTPLYDRLGFDIVTLHSVRKAQSWLKKNKPVMVVTEFNFDSNFRDRMSTLESLMATFQCYQLSVQVVVFVESEHLSRLEHVKQRYHIEHVIPYPIDKQVLSDALMGKSLAPSLGLIEDNSKKNNDH